MGCNAGITPLAQAIKPVSKGGSGAMANCTHLYLHKNQIGNLGIIALAKACNAIPLMLLTIDSDIETAAYEALDNKEPLQIR